MLLTGEMLMNFAAVIVVQHKCFSLVWFHQRKGKHLSPDACGEGSPSKPDVSRSPWAPRTPMGSAWSPEARSASGSSLTGKEMSLMGSSLILGGLQSSRAFSGFTSRSYSSDSSLLTWRRETGGADQSPPPSLPSLTAVRRFHSPAACRCDSP